MKTIYLASGNAHKLHELQAALEDAGLPIRVRGPGEIGGMPEVEETGSTFEANALLKAEGLRALGPRDGWFLADDSGIEIDALGGRPGVISARYAGTDCDDEANNDKVLDEMREVPKERRACRFRCVLALVGDGLEETFSGSCEGLLLEERRGTGGFGYDPLFLPYESESTLPRSPRGESQNQSPARALVKLVDWLGKEVA